jgi:hypothetical protein
MLVDGIPVNGNMIPEPEGKDQVDVKIVMG